MSFEVIVYQLLRVCGIRVNKTYLSERLKAHPDYPSLASLTDLLDEWQLDYSALQLEPAHLSEMEYPFLAHVVTKEGMEDFEIIKNAKQLERDKERFLSVWTGIVVWIAGESNIQSEEHDRELSTERLHNKTFWVLGLIALAVLGYTYSQDFSSINSGYALLSLTGIIISAAIVGYASGVDNSISKSFCKVGASDCQKVINSDFSRLLPNVHLPDIALAYFTGLFLAQSFSSGVSFEVLTSLFIIPAGGAFLGTFMTLGYQAFKGEWCKLCLILTAVIWMQAALIVLYLPSPFVLKIDNALLGQSLLAFALGFGWILLKPFVTKSQKVDSQNITIRKWRQNPRWFQALLPLHKGIDQGIWSKEIFYGNPNGALQITLATGPYCQPCSVAHAQIEHIFGRYPEDIGIKIRFVIKEAKPKDKEATMAVLNAYNQLVWHEPTDQPYFQNPLSQQIIKDWFLHQDLKAFNKLYERQEEVHKEMESLLRQHIRWGQQFQIEQTPGFFVNGFEMPNPHTLADLNIFLDSYIEQLKSPVSLFEIEQQPNQPLS